MGKGGGKDWKSFHTVYNLEWGFLLMILFSALMNLKPGPTRTQEQEDLYFGKIT